MLSRCPPAKNSNIEDDLEEILIFPLFVMFHFLGDRIPPVIISNEIEPQEDAGSWARNI